MRQEELAVHLHHLKDAKCVADALGQGDASVIPSKTGWDASVIPSKTGWTVSVVPSSRQLAEILNALHACLAENDIRLVRLTIDGSTYAMESPPAD
ncbi:MAG TPA: hypothetical protein VFP31_13140 [Gaiellaceae bacterium]|nr:hypothetical protein [Gaiellaceae bacterium]